MVGSVIVKNGQILGEGFHPKAGNLMQRYLQFVLHNKRGGSARCYSICQSGALQSLWTNASCSEAIIKAGIGEVVIGAIDANPQVSGTGRDRLLAAGVKVTTGVLEQQCWNLNEAFFHRMKTNLPFGIFKYAMTLDGKIATTSGHSYWITGAEARHLVHDLRVGCDAIITGGNTVRLDNPHLNTHGLSVHSLCE